MGSLPAANPTPTYQPPAPPNPPSSQHLSQATDLAANLSPVSQTPNSSLTTQSITQSDIKHLRNAYVEAAAITNAMLATEGSQGTNKVVLTDEQFTNFNNNVNTTLKTTLLGWLQQSMPTADAIVESKIPTTDSKKKPSDHQQPNIVFSPTQFQELNRNLNETLKTEVQTELRALDIKRSTTDMAALVKAFKEDNNTLHLLTEAVAGAIKGTLKPTIEALATAAVERNISEAENKLQG